MFVNVSMTFAAKFAAVSRVRSMLQMPSLGCRQLMDLVHEELLPTLP